MKLALLTAPLGNLELAAMLATCAELGYDGVELGTGEFTTDFHAGLPVGDPSERARVLLDAAATAEVELAALSCHGNPLHPAEDYAKRADDVFRRTVIFAEALGVSTVNLFSGCPGEPGGVQPNWITSTWPEYFDALLRWQWEERVTPYWRSAAQFAADHGVRLAFEMHPGNVVYNPDALLRLRDACGPAVGANLDPSHLWWQGMDPLLVARELLQHRAIFHVHAKDVLIDAHEVTRVGVLANEPYRSGRPPWAFSTVGSGHGATFWRALVDELRAGGYDGFLSVEHEDPLAPPIEALQRSARLLNECVWRGSERGLEWLEDHDPPFPTPWTQSPDTPN